MDKKSSSVWLFYFVGLLSANFSVISAYPVVNNENSLLGFFFVSITAISFFLFCKRTSLTVASSIAGALYLVFATITFQCIGLLLYLQVFSNAREFSLFSPIFALFFSLFRLPFGTGDGTIYLYGIAEYVFRFIPTAGNMGFLSFLLLSFGLMPILSAVKSMKKSLVGLALIIGSLFLYLFLRTFCLVLLFLAQDVGSYRDTWFSLGLFWHPITSFLSFLPWILFLKILNPQSLLTLNPFDHLLSPKSLKKQTIPALLSGIGMLCLAFSLFWIPSAEKKQGRILFEEYYSDWTKSTKPIDEEWYSMASTYNYYTFRTFIDSYYDVTLNEEPLDNTNLSLYDIVLIKIPTKAYSERALHNIVRFVKRGGGLWVIGDHTNVFGSSTYLNPLLTHFGVLLRHDAIYHNVHGSFNTYYEKEPIKHPIMHKVPLFLFATSCSIQIRNPRIRRVIPGLTTKSYPINYANENFFPDTKADLNIPFGPHTLMAAGAFGKGRIAVFTDSTIFSNFYMYLPGKPELALSTLAWLNHKEPHQLIKAVLLVLSILFLSSFIGLSIYKKMFRRTREGTGNLPILVICVVLMLAVPLVNTLNKSSFSFPAEKRPQIKVSFIGDYSDIFLPFQEWKQGLENDYNTFYVWGQRVGVRTQYVQTVSEAVEESAALFMMLPTCKFDENDLRLIDLYLKQGGKLFLLDHGGSGSSSNDLLRNYNLTLEYQSDGKGRIRSSERGTLFSFMNTVPVGIVKGEGETILIWEGENGSSAPIFVKKSVGKGTLYVFGGILNFSNAQFGHSGFVPTGEKKQVNELMLGIYNLVIDKRLF